MSLPLDSHGCVAPISAVTDLHDKLLKLSVADLRRKHPQVEIVFFDLGPAYLDVLDHAAGFGFLETARPCYLSETLLRLLPGGGGPRRRYDGRSRRRQGLHAPGQLLQLGWNPPNRCYASGPRVSLPLH